MKRQSGFQDAGLSESCALTVRMESYEDYKDDFLCSRNIGGMH